MSANPKIARELLRRHSELCFQRAFPRTVGERKSADEDLSQFAASISRESKSARDQLADSGIDGTSLHYSFSYDMARWLASQTAACVSIDWAELDDCELLDNLLSLILLPSEDEYFDSGYVATKEWIDIASAGFKGTDFEWLMTQLKEPRLQNAYRQLYDAADIPLLWNLDGSRFSKTGNVFGNRRIANRGHGMRARPSHVKQEIARPVESISRLSERQGSALVDVAIASLAARHRETYHFSFANPREVYLADVVEGVSIAVFGLLPEHRFPLECTFGYLILSNGVPIGYGGSSVLFRQVNTGINIFDEYRGSEAAFLWVQVMRVYHSLVGCTRFIANAYQFGGENVEALRSGAFWFYYRLGYRPVDTSTRKLALVEQRKIREKPGYRCDLQTLRNLSTCDMHLTLPGARQSEFFDEEWIATSSGLATQILGRAGGRTRLASANRVVRRLTKDLGINSSRSWSSDERRGLAAIAPFIADLQPSNWTQEEKRHTGNLILAKGGQRELAYAKLMATDERFLQELRAKCIEE